MYTQRITAKLLFFAIAAILLMTNSLAFAQVLISNGTSNTQTFDGIGTSATATLPTGFRVDKITTGVRTVGTFTGAGTATERVGGDALGTSAANGIYNFGAGPAATATDRAVGFLSSGSATQSGNLYEQIQNNGTTTITQLNLSYTVEKYRNGTNPNGFTIQLYTSTDGTTFTAAPAPFTTSFPSDANNNGFTPAPGATVTVTGSLPVSIAPGASFYLAFNYSVTTGTVTTNAQALAIDNITISAPALTPTITVTPATLAFPGTPVGSSSAEQTYTISGSNLTGNIVINAPAGFEISTTSGAGFTNQITLMNNAGAVAATTIFVRFTPTSATSFSGNITNASAGATTQNVAVSGTGIAATSAPTITSGSSTTFAQGTAGSFQVTATGNPAPTFSVMSGTLPAGVTLSTSGLLSGTPTQAGTFTFTITATNSAGAANQTFTLIVADTEAPNTTITAAPPASGNQPNVSFSFTGTDNVGVNGFECSIDNGTTFAACTSPQTYTLADGTYTFMVRAVDAAGNRDQTPAAFTFTIDATAPTAPVVSTPANGTLTNNNTPVISGTAEANSVVTIFVDGTSIGTTTATASGTFAFTPAAALADGARSVRATATDAFGNLSVVSNTNTFTIDTSAPAVLSIAATSANPTTTGSPVTYTVTFSEAVTGVDATDFVLTTTGGIAGASITGVTGSGTTYTVTVNSGTGTGTVRLDLVDNDSIVDAASNVLGGAGGGGGAQGQVVTINAPSAPTAALITIGGRVTTAGGRAVAGARIIMTDADGGTRTALTNPFGYYRFVDVEVGQTVIFEARHKNRTFAQPTQIVSLEEDTQTVNFTAY